MKTSRSGNGSVGEVPLGDNAMSVDDRQESVGLVRTKPTPIAVDDDEVSSYSSKSEPRHTLVYQEAFSTKGKATEAAPNSHFSPMLTGTQTPRHTAPGTSAHSGATTTPPSNFVQRKYSALRVANNAGTSSGLFCSIALDDAALASDFFGPQLESVGYHLYTTPSPQQRRLSGKDGLLALMPFPHNMSPRVITSVEHNNSTAGYYGTRPKKGKLGHPPTQTGLQNSISISYASSASSNSPYNSHSRNSRAVAAVFGTGASGSALGGIPSEPLLGATYATTTSSSGGGEKVARFMSSNSTHSTHTIAGAVTSTVAVPALSMQSRLSATPFLEGTDPSGGRVIIATPCPIGPSRSANRAGPQRSQSENTTFASSLSTRATNTAHIIEFTSLAPASSLECNSVPTQSVATGIRGILDSSHTPSSCSPPQVSPPSVFTTGFTPEASLVAQPHAFLKRIRSGAGLRAKPHRQLQVSISDPAFVGSESTNPNPSSLGGTLTNVGIGRVGATSRSQWVSVTNERRLDLSSITSLVAKTDGNETPSLATTPTNTTVNSNGSSPMSAATRRLRFAGGAGFSAASALLSRSSSPIPMVGVGSPNCRVGPTFCNTVASRGTKTSGKGHQFSNNGPSDGGGSLAKEFIEQYAKRKGCDVAALASVIVGQQQHARKGLEASVSTRSRQQDQTPEEEPSSFQVLNFLKRRASDDAAIISLHTGVTTSTVLSNTDPTYNNSLLQSKLSTTPRPHSTASVLTDQANLSTSRENLVLQNIKAATGASTNTTMCNNDNNSFWYTCHPLDAQPNSTTVTNEGESFFNLSSQTDGAKLLQGQSKPLLGSSMMVRSNSNGEGAARSSNSQSLQPLTPNLSHKTAAAAPPSVAWGTVSDSSTASTLLTSGAALEDQPTPPLTELCQYKGGSAHAMPTPPTTTKNPQTQIIAPLFSQSPIPLPSPHQRSLNPVKGPISGGSTSISHVLAASGSARSPIEPLPPITSFRR